MPDQLAPHEKTAFGVLSVVLTRQGPVERDSLRVLVASRGGDLGRDYLRLRDLGFVEEVEVRPGFLRRLFGAKPKRMVRLTARGVELAARLAGEAVAGELGAVAEAVVEGAVMPAVEAVTAPEPEAVSVPEAVTAPAAEAAAAPAAAVPVTRRYTPADFTEALGGSPVEDAPALPEGERLEGLAELLGLMGFELMPAGRLLAVHRWAEGRADAEVALEVLLASVAHAVRLDRTGTARLDPGAMLAVIDTVGAALGQFVAEDALGAGPLAESLASMRAFVTGGAAAEGAIALLLEDPLRGLAPPAICPEGVWVPADDGEE